jgi:spore maturation protein CgeB
MRVLYIGQYSYGTTSRMRGESIRLSPFVKCFNYIDTNIPFFKCNKLWQSVGFRYKIGPLIPQINKYILNKIDSKKYDLIWVDKGIFIKPETLIKLKNQCDKIIHYTPDAAFYQNKSVLFERCIILYDYLITTKSFEKIKYLNFVSEYKLFFTTQGYDETIHKPIVPFPEKNDAVVFIGLYEPAREHIIKSLIEAKIPVHIGGMGWSKFLKQNKSDLLSFLGERVIGENYAQSISACKFGLGILSKKFPELHTTRTFEMPACGTALLTERNSETTRFYSDSDVIFYSDVEELINKVRHYIADDSSLKSLTHNGRLKSKAYSYQNIIPSLIKQIFAN